MARLQVALVVAMLSVGVNVDASTDLRWDAEYDAVTTWVGGSVGCQWWNVKTQKWSMGCQATSKSIWDSFPEASCAQFSATGSPGLSGALSSSQSGKGGKGGKGYQYPKCSSTSSKPSASSSRQQTTRAATTAAPASVFESVRVEGVDYSLLTANPQMLSAFQKATVDSMTVTSAVEVIDVQVSSGSLIAVLEVRVPAGQTQESIRELLQRNHDRLEAVEEQAVRSLHGIESVSVGTISVTHCGVSADRASIQKVCFAIPLTVQPVPQASMPADLNLAIQLAKVQGSGFDVHMATPWFFILAAVAFLGLVAAKVHRSGASGAESLLEESVAE